MAFDAPPGVAGEPALATRTYRAYVLGLLVAAGIVAWVDRNVLAMLLESIKTDLALSDTQLGLLGGVAFGLFYATVGLPVAWLADRYSRRSLIAAALAAFSVATALCGMAGSFATLFAARIGVGIGEAGASPPSQSLLSDYFAPERRAAALGVFYLHIPLGYLVGFGLGGWLDDAFGWRLAFALVGLPGLALAAIVRLTLREPRRGGTESAHDAAHTPSLAASLRYMLARGALRHLPLAGAAHAIGAFAAAVWLPSYFVRSFGVSGSEAGLFMALAYGVGGGIGALSGGWLADRVAARTGDARWYAWGSAAAICAALPFAVPVYLTSTPWIAVAGLFLAMTVSHLFLGPVMATVQNLAGVRRRAVAAAVYLLLVNLVSMGAGPLAVGAISDAFGARFGNDSLRYALLGIVVTTTLWSATHFLLAARTLRADLAFARGDRAT